MSDVTRFCVQQSSSCTNIHFQITHHQPQLRPSRSGQSAFYKDHDHDTLPPCQPHKPKLNAETPNFCSKRARLHGRRTPMLIARQIWKSARPETIVRVLVTSSRAVNDPYHHVTRWTPEESMQQLKGKWYVSVVALIISRSLSRRFVGWSPSLQRRPVGYSLCQWLA